MDVFCSAHPDATVAAPQLIQPEAPVPSSQAPSSDAAQRGQPSKVVIEIAAVDANDETDIVMFKMLSTSPFGKVKAAWCARYGLLCSEACLLFRGRVVLDNDTPADYGWPDQTGAGTIRLQAVPKADTDAGAGPTHQPADMDVHPFLPDDSGESEATSAEAAECTYRSSDAVSTEAAKDREFLQAQLASRAHASMARRREYIVVEVARPCCCDCDCRHAAWWSRAASSSVAVVGEPWRSACTGSEGVPLGMKWADCRCTPEDPAHDAELVQGFRDQARIRPRLSSTLKFPVTHWHRHVQYAENQFKNRECSKRKLPQLRARHDSGVSTLHLRILFILIGAIAAACIACHYMSSACSWSTAAAATRAVFDDSFGEQLASEWTTGVSAASCITTQVHGSPRLWHIAELVDNPGLTGLPLLSLSDVRSSHVSTIGLLMLYDHHHGTTSLGVAALKERVHSPLWAELPHTLKGIIKNFVGGNAEHDGGTFETATAGRTGIEHALLRRVRQ